MRARLAAMSHRRPVPPDFDQFWRDLAANAISIAPHVEGIAERTRGVVRFTSSDGVRVGGWVVLPDGPPTCAVVVGHGYGGRETPDEGWGPRDAAMMFPVARGLPTLSLMDHHPVDSQEHVLHGIGSRNTYVLGHCAADLVWCALSALEEILGRVLGERRGGLRTSFVGTSFGGGIGALAAPWDDRIDAVALEVPTFGANAERLAADCTGSSAALVRHVQKDPSAWAVLDYFDAATAAARLAVPTVIATASTDPAVPPVGQRAIAEAVAPQLRTVVPLSTGHLDDDPKEIEALRALVRDLVAGPVKD